LIFQIYKFLVADQIGMANLHRLNKSHKDQPNGFEHIAIFSISKWRPFAMLDFQILKFVVVNILGMDSHAMYITVPNFIKNGQKVVEISSFLIFKMAAVCCLNFFIFLNYW